MGNLPGVVGLRGNYEGQWLVDGLSDLDRWWPEKFVDYASVASVWEQRLREIRKDEALKYVFEKSPPNMVRYRKLLKILPNARIVLNNRDPYANVASQVKRYHDLHYSGTQRHEVIRHLTDLWLYRSRFLQQAHQRDQYPIVTYEQFCADPKRILSAYSLDAGTDFVSHATVKVKDYEAQGIRNMNEEQIALLAPEEMELVTSRLREAEELVQFFGYELRTGTHA